MMDADRLLKEIGFLKKYPHFEERPASLSEFLGSDYLNIEAGVRPRIRYELEQIMGREASGDRMTQHPLALITGAIGIGKTTVASIVLPYLAHWCLCLKDPQAFFDLLPGSRVALMMMSTSEKQALEVVFTDVKARIQHSNWFKKYPIDPAFKNQIRFPKDVWIIPGDSAETTFEGYNILGGILDEADSHKVTADRDYADQGFDTIYNRMSSRFNDRGFVLIIGQMKRASGFVARKFDEFSARDDAYAVRLSIWESRGKDYYRDPETGEVETFFFDSARKRVIPKAAVELLGGKGEHILEIPKLYYNQFVNNPEKALKDLAGIPPAVNDPFISLVDKIYAARDRWVQRYGPESPVDPKGRLQPWFYARDSIKRVAHLDIAYSGKGDALGFAMGHVPEVIDIDGELKPFIVIDLLLRIKAMPGQEIFLWDVRQRIYGLRNDRKFKLDRVTMDGFESTDTKQQLERRRFETDYVSIDRQVLPYHDLREALYEDRIAFPPYIVDVWRESGSEQVEILVKELTELVDSGKKIDHPPNGSKDVADAVAGVVFTLMGDRRYHRRVVDLSAVRQERQAVGDHRFKHPAYLGDAGFSAPLPPTNWR